MTTRCSHERPAIFAVVTIGCAPTNPRAHTNGRRGADNQAPAPTSATSATPTSATTPAMRPADRPGQRGLLRARSPGGISPCANPGSGEAGDPAGAVCAPSEPSAPQTAHAPSSRRWWLRQNRQRQFSPAVAIASRAGSTTDAACSGASGISYSSESSFGFPQPVHATKRPRFRVRQLEHRQSISICRACPSFPIAEAYAGNPPAVPGIVLRASQGWLPTPTPRQGNSQNERLFGTMKL